MKLLGDGTLQVMGVDVTPAAGSDQGSVYAWDTVATAGYKDTVRAWNLLVTDVAGTSLINTTASTDGNRVQYSPMQVLGGRAYRHTAGVEDQGWNWAMQVRPIAGSSAASTSALHFLSANDIGTGGAGPMSAYTSRANLSSSGVLTAGAFTVGGIYINANVSLYDFGTVDYYGMTADRPLVVLNNARTTGASRVVHYFAAAQTSANLVNTSGTVWLYADAATMRLASFSMGNSTTNTSTELAAIMCDGTYVSSYSRNLLATYATGMLLENATPATLADPIQHSPVMAVGGTAWAATAGGTGASQTNQFGFVCRPINSAGGSSSAVLTVVVKAAGGTVWSIPGSNFDASGGVSGTTLYASTHLYNNRASVGTGAATVYTPGAYLIGTTKAVAPAGISVQDSTAVVWSGSAWDTTQLTSDCLDFACKLVPTSGAATSATLQWGYRKTAGTPSTAGLGGGSGTGNFATAMSLTSGGLLTANSLANAIGSWASGFSGSFGDISGPGLSSADGFLMSGTASRANCFLNGTRTDGANNNVFSFAYRSAAATITNSATMRLVAFGWTATTAGPTYTYYEVASIRPNGDLFFNGGTNGQSLAIKSLTEETTVAVGETTKDTTIQIPAGAVVLAVAGRVTTGSGVVSTVDIGVSGALTRYATGIDISAAGATWLGTMDATRYYAAATAITITPNAALETNPAKLRITIHFYLPTAPTS